MKDRWESWGPLGGVLFVVVLVVTLAAGGTEPDPTAGAASVIAWYQAHHARVRVADYLMALVLVCALFFYGYLRDLLAQRSPGLARTAFGGAVLFAVAGALSAGTQLALAADPSRLSDGAAQALNLTYSYTATVADNAGPAVALIAFGAAVLREPRLRGWLGWLGIVLGVVSLVPLRGIGPLPAGLWTLIASVTLMSEARRKSRRPREVSASVAG